MNGTACRDELWRGIRRNVSLKRCVSVMERPSAALTRLIRRRFDPPLLLHAQDVIGPIDELGAFDDAGETRKLLLAILHAAQIADLR